ncbi:LuxR C-terminal-related transcriptional regulator [Nocardioides sp. P5_E3]
MADPLGRKPSGNDGAPRAAFGDVVESKLHRPPVREDWIDRTRLLEAMMRAVRHPVTLVCAPAGYGKTTLVAQWTQCEGLPPTAWVSLDNGDNDPDRLWSHVAASLERAGCVLPVSDPVRVLDGTPSWRPRALLWAITTALAAAPEDLVLVLDDFHFVQSPERHTEVETLVASLPEHAHLVITSRADPGLRLGRLRVSHDLVELRAEQLGFTVVEARKMLAHQGVTLSDNALVQLVERTEGWPAALYLAALSLTGRTDADDFVRRFSGGNRFVGDYLIEEVLSRQPERLRDFILGVSVLDQLTAELCDHVLERTDSATVLQQLERANLFLVPLDAQRRWFRFHNLFRAVALSELELTLPDVVDVLRARAGDWFSTHGDVSEAIKNWLKAGRTQEAATLVQTNWLQFADAGRAGTVLSWLNDLGPPSGPAALVTAAWMAALTGDETALARHLEALDGLEELGPLPDGSQSVSSSIAQMRGLLGYGGPADMLTAARLAVALETNPRSPQYTIAHLAFGHALYVHGDLDGAVVSLQAATHSRPAPGIIRIMSQSLLSFAEHERGNLIEAREHAEQAMDILNRQTLRAAPQASWAFVALAQAQAVAGKTDEAVNTLELGLAARRTTNAQGVWAPIHHLLLSARLFAQLGDTDQGRELLAELTQRMNRFPDTTPAMMARVETTRRLLTNPGAERILDEPLNEPLNEPLTGRELDVLRLMQGPLNLSEIASELYLSSNTVKSHAQAVYRKLGAHSRAEAVVIGRRRSLI